MIDDTSELCICLIASSIVLVVGAKLEVLRTALPEVAGEVHGRLFHQATSRGVCGISGS
ncbi:MAG: hypothetical protein ACI89J_003890 [Hyphomicrobiaceae bacterium]|jgi:hypothetical protein